VALLPNATAGATATDQPPPAKGASEGLAAAPTPSQSAAQSVPAPAALASVPQNAPASLLTQTAIEPDAADAPPASAPGAAAQSPAQRASETKPTESSLGSEAPGWVLAELAHTIKPHKTRANTHACFDAHVIKRSQQKVPRRKAASMGTVLLNPRINNPLDLAFAIPARRSRHPSVELEPIPQPLCAIASTHYLTSVSELDHDSRELEHSPAVAPVHMPDFRLPEMPASDSGVAPPQFSSGPPAPVPRRRGISLGFVPIDGIFDAEGSGAAAAPPPQ
jgi:hypothetical protein